jgi:predicted RNA-binding Zn-ribbon protein involved in translation (DUF1610 family)
MKKTPQVSHGVMFKGKEITTPLGVRPCPRCGKPLEDCPSLSRHDNETAICSDCGTLEAFEDSGMAPAYAGKPYWITTTNPNQG